MTTRRSAWTGGGGYVLAAVACLLAVASLTPAVAAEEVTGRVDAVTVYRGQAMVTREVAAPDRTGQVELVVTGLPTRVIPASLQAQGGEGVTVRSVQYRNRAVRRDVREDVAAIDDEIEALEHARERLERERRQLEEEKQLLERVGSFTAQKAESELNRGLLVADTLERLVAFQFEHGRRISDRSYEIGREQRTLAGRIEVLRRQRSNLASGSARTIHEAVVFLDVATPGAPVRVSYLVTGATWQPFYNVRVQSDGQRLTLEQMASLQQTSGEDWPEARITLSTAAPTQSASAPRLLPLEVELIDAGSEGGAAGSGPSLHQLRDQQEALQQAQATTGGRWDASYNRRINEFAKSSQLASELRELPDDAPGGELVSSAAGSPSEGITVSYSLPGRVSLPSRSDQQLIQIASLPMEAEIYHVAFPLLSSYVFREAELTNTTGRVLLGGPSSVYLDGEFVGRGETPTAAAGQSLVLGLGVDSSLLVSRDLVDRATRTQGGNEVVSVSVRLGLANFSDEPRTVRVYDRMPKADDAGVKITLERSSLPLSEDVLYTRNLKPHHILRWDVESPAQAFGESATLLTFRYVAEYDRQKQIVGVSSNQTAQGFDPRRHYSEAMTE